MKCLRAENKRIISLVAKLTATNEALSLQLKQKEDALTKRRIEVATLHQACAKYKRNNRIALTQRVSHRLPKAATSMNTALAIKQAVSASDVPTTIEAACLHCQKANDVFERQLKVALEGLAEKLRTEFAEKEAQYTSALREKDDQIGKHVATLAAKERAEQEKRQRIERQRAEEQERQMQHIEDTIREMAEMKARNQRQLDEQRAQRQRLARERELQRERESAQRLKEIDERFAQQSRLIELQSVVLRRRRAGVSDSAFDAAWNVYFN